MVHEDRSLAHSNGSPHALTSKERGRGNRKRMDMSGKVSGVGAGIKRVPVKENIYIYNNIKSKIIKQNTHSRRRMDMLGKVSGVGVGM